MHDLLLYLLGVLILLFGLALSIGLHEIGHLLPAKIFGVKVNRYMIGFGPTIWSKKKGETEYGVKAIPLGGYVAMIGMYPPAKNSSGEAEAKNKRKGFFAQMVQDARDASNEEVQPGDETRTFYRLSTPKKITVMLGGPFMNLILAFVFFGILVSGFGVAQPSTKIAYVSECLLPAGSQATECGPADEAAPAAAAGVLPGDEIKSIAGVSIDSWGDISELITAAAGQSLQLVVLRSGEELSLQITPHQTLRYIFDKNGQIAVDEAGDPLTETVGMIGVTPTSEVVRQPLTAVPGYVFENVKAVANIIVHLPQRLVAVWDAAFGPEERELESPISVIGVGRLAGEIVSHDQAPVSAKIQIMIGLLASLNVALLVFNLVPLLPLDGGHVAGALYEGAKRRIWRLFGKADPGPVDTAKMVPITIIVATLLIGMTLLLIYADLVKPIRLFN